MPDRISDFVALLQSEIDALKKSTVAIDLSAGLLLGQQGRQYLYSFSASNLLEEPEENATANIEIAGQNFDCIFLNAQGLKIIVALPQIFGEVIPAAKLTVNGWLNLHRLQEKLRAAKKTGQDFKLAEEVFNGAARPFGAVGSKAKFSYEAKDAPDFSQGQAIANSFSNSLAIICGPPGSGKTSTIARLVEAHVNAGRRVLLVCRTNGALNSALTSLVKPLAKSVYGEGKIIRLGQGDTGLFKQYPLLELDGAAAAVNAQLVKQREEVAARLKPLQDNLHRCQNLASTGELVKNLERETQRPEKLLSQQERYRQLSVEIGETEVRLKAAHQYLDPHVRATHIHDLTQRISTLNRHLQEITSNVQNLAAQNAAQMQELGQANFELARLMDETGLTPGDVGQYIDVANRKLEQFDQNLTALDIEIAAAAQKTVSAAQVIGTTLNELVLSHLLTDETFDIVVLDEAATVPLPHLYWALSRATIGVTLVGDFNQLPAGHSQNIFDHLNVNTLAGAGSNKIISLLDTQYRIAPEIAQAASALYYGGLLKSDETTYQIGLNDSVFAAARLVIVDTSAVDPWCINAASGSRSNIYSAGLAINLCRRLLNEHAQITVGLTTPYSHQAEILGKTLASEGNRALSGTMKGFPAVQPTVMILDCVDGKGSKRSWLDDDLSRQGKNHDQKNSTVPQLLNMSLFRAQAAFIIIVNLKYFAETQKGTTFMKFLAQLASAGAVKIDCKKVDDCFAARNTRNTEIAAANDFWKAFGQDLLAAQHSVLFVSPGLTLNRCQYFSEQLKAMVAQGLTVMVYTRPAAELQQEHEAREAASAIAHLKNIGITVKERSNLQQKIALIDERICWEGGLNILGQGSSLEHMRRCKSDALAAEVRRGLAL